MSKWKDEFIETVLDKLREKGTTFSIIRHGEPIPLFTTSDITDALYEVFEGDKKMIEWKDIATTELIPGKAYRIKIIDTVFDNICLYVDGGCFIFYDETKPGVLGCVERKVVFCDRATIGCGALALPIGDYKVSDNTEFPLPFPCQVMKIYNDIEPGCVMIKELE